jgi:hypothetical protein
VPALKSLFINDITFFESVRGCRPGKNHPARIAAKSNQSLTLWIINMTMQASALEPLQPAEKWKNGACSDE